MQHTEDLEGTSRRSFLLSTGSLFTTAWLGTQWAAITAAAHHAADMAAADLAAAPAWKGFQFLSESESKDVDAIAAQIVPSGATPGAREAHAVYFIDRALTTFDQDKQAAYTQGLKDLSAKTHELFPDAGRFSGLSSTQQIRVLTAIEKTPFFAQVRLHTIVGFFANPEYGGNDEKIGWNLIGFEDKFSWEPPFGHYDREFKQS